MLMIGSFGVEPFHPNVERGDHLLCLPAAEFDARPITNAVFGFAQQIEQFGNRFPRDPDGLDRRTRSARHAIDTPVDVVATGVAQMMLEMADDRILPLEEVNRPIGSDLEIDGPEIRVIRLNERFDFFPYEPRIFVGDLVLENPEKSDDV